MHRPAARDELSISHGIQLRPNYPRNFAPP